MAEKPPPNPNPVLQKPPGYRDPNAPPPPPKPKQVVLPAAFRHQPPRKRHPKRCTCRFCCCLLLLGLLFVLFVVSVVGALSFLWFQPRVPSFHLQSIVPVRLNVSSRADGTFVSARTVVRVLAYNPNSKIGFYYSQCRASVSAGEGGDNDDEVVNLGSGTAEGFEQGRKNTTVVKLTAEVREEMVDDDAGERLRERLNKNKNKNKNGEDEVRYMVEMRTRLGLVVNGRRSGTVPVRVRCGWVSFREMERGESPRCNINILKW
ncbi:hypothetical protein QJS10_CPB22g00079 [Acorus calamus]|uniref:Late embryogenesis abundant protein LEA-2 subgroup domain-containing protein n=1 Tax=Acorus calamus TaxID=4465 RepID=A0AAV9BZJ6_ACOCL|nr:hypothetical protein QJS10_CPB22g00079 [Acorus calamus]